MSKNSPEPHSSEEVDLGKLFMLISDLIYSFFRFIGNLLNHIFLALIWCVFFVKKHGIKLLISVALGISYGIYKEKTADPVYRSHITIKQNYNTGEDLYNSVDYFNDLLSQEDTLQLGNVLGISAKQAAVILKFDIQSVIIENEHFKEFNDYRKTLDTTIASKVSYDDFVLRYKEPSYQFQKLIIIAKERNNFNLVFKKIVSLLNGNQYFLSEQAKDLAELNSKKLALEKALSSSQVLQTTYRKVLEESQNAQGTEIGISFEASSKKSKTKEYDLYLNDIELSSEIVKIERRIADKEKIVEIVSGKQDSGSVYNRKYLFGLGLSDKVYFGICFMLATLCFLLGSRVYKFMEQYKGKV